MGMLQWFKMTDGEASLFYGYEQFFAPNRYRFIQNKIDAGQTLNDSEARDLRGYKMRLEEIDRRDLNYSALLHNFFIEIGAMFLDASGIAMKPNLRESKRLPYKILAETRTA